MADARELIDRWLDGTLDAAAHAELEQRLHDREFAKEFLRAVHQEHATRRALVGRAERQDAGVHSGKLKSLPRRRVRRTSGERPSWLAPLAAAAVLALVAGAGWWLWTSTQPGRTSVASNTPAEKNNVPVSPEAIGRVAYAQAGRVTLRLHNGTTVGADAGHPVFAGDGIETASASGEWDGGAACHVLLWNGAELVVAPGTRLRAGDSATPGTPVVHLEQGRLSADSGALTRAGRSLRIASAAGEAVTEGTRFEAAVEERGLVVRVAEGAVRLSNVRGQVRVAAGQEATAPKDSAPAAPVAFDPSTLWTGDRRILVEDFEVAEPQSFLLGGSSAKPTLARVPGKVGQAAVRFTHTVEKPDADGWAMLCKVWKSPVSWSGGTHLEFWLRGQGEGATMGVELNSKRAPGGAPHETERFVYSFKDSVKGWTRVSIPFSAFTRRTDFQPPNAPHHGLDLGEINAVSIYADWKSGMSFEIDQIEVRVPLGR